MIRKARKAIGPVQDHLYTFAAICKNVSRDNIHTALNNVGYTATFASHVSKSVSKT